MPTVAPVARRGTGLGRIAAAVAAAVLTIVVLWLGLRLAARSEPIRDRIAQATVTAGNAHLREAAAETSPSLASIPKESVVNVLQLPSNLGSGWALVQWVRSGEDSPAGYVRAVDLAEWSSTKPETALRILRLELPAPDASDGTLAAFADKAMSFCERFPETPEAAEAGWDGGSLLAGMVRRAAASNGDPGTLREFAGKASALLDRAGVRADFRERAAALKQEVALALLPLADPAALLKHARELIEKGDTAGAEAALTAFLARTPDSAAAKALLAKVRAGR
jgi:hypothetical protein